MTRKLFLPSLLFLALIITSCSHKVQRVSTNETIDLSGRWNDTDSRMVAEAMVNQVLSGGWVHNFATSHQGKKPIVVVGLVSNKTHEHINSETFIKDVERAFINSGRVRLVQAAERRNELRTERAAQKDFVSSETAKKWGKELGADFMLNGDINSIVDTYKKERITFYQTNLELSDLETSEVVWMGAKKIKKYIRK